MTAPHAPRALRPAELRRIAGWLTRGRIDQIEIETANSHIRMVMHPALPCPHDGAEAPAAPAAPAADATPSAKPHAAAPREVLADTPGIFLAGHPARTQAFCAVGAVVRQGDHLGLVRAGLVYRPVVAPVGGELVAVCAASGAQVAYATPLFLIAPQENAP